MHVSHRTYHDGSRDVDIVLPNVCDDIHRADVRIVYEKGTAVVFGVTERILQSANCSFTIADFRTDDEAKITVVLLCPVWLNGRFSLKEESFEQTYKVPGKSVL